MGFHRIDVSAVEQVFVGVRIVDPNPVHQIVLPHHFRAGTGGTLGRSRSDRRIGGLHLTCAAASSRHLKSSSGIREYSSNENIAVPSSNRKKGYREMLNKIKNKTPKNKRPGFPRASRSTKLSSTRHRGPGIGIIVFIGLLFR